MIGSLIFAPFFLFEEHVPLVMSNGVLVAIPVLLHYVGHCLRIAMAPQSHLRICNVHGDRLMKIFPLSLLFGVSAE